ncbi:MAG TPA: glycosyltransferase [Thermoleophilaceae bacterium]|jgi:glycosyltransferase involved in cell wall biosynthesis
MSDERAPEIAVAVPTRDRPLRLRWLLNALEEQTLDRERFEVVVAHDSRGPETAELLAEHPLADAGTLSAIEFPPHWGTAGAKRNAAWRATRAPTVVFTDDDCRPPSYWLERALAAARRHPGAVVQGRTEPDPDEVHLERAAPHAHTRRVRPPEPWAQSCNIAYPRELLDRVGGFPDDLDSGEDTELAAKARRAGAPYVAAPEVLTYHAVVPQTLREQLRGTRRWEDLPAMVERNPELRRDLPLWVFWKRTHVWIGPAAAGAALARRRGARWALLALPYLIHALPQEYGTGPRGRVRALAELPGRTAVDVAEVAALVRGSVRARNLLL